MERPEHIYGIHDWDPVWGEMVRANGRTAWCVTTHAMTQQSGFNFAPMAEYGVAPIARLNWGYGSTGTIPKQENWERFAENCVNFIANSPGHCRRWIIGNEPNHSQEWPDGEPISPASYAKCFHICRDLIHEQLGGHHKIYVAAVAPWNDSAGPWMDYYRTMLYLTGGGDGIALHTYTHGPYPGLITSDVKMDPPFEEWRYEFRSYLDFLSMIPDQVPELPIIITETDQDVEWLNSNNGWVQQAYAEIDRWNQIANTNWIEGLVLYRWPNYDKWGFEDKTAVHQMFVEALRQDYRIPEPVIAAPEGGEHRINLPAIHTGQADRPSEPIQVLEPQTRVWDERLTERGVSIETPKLSPGERYWKVTTGRWLNPSESKGRHHIFVDVLNEAGERLPGVRLGVVWPSGGGTIETKSKPGEIYAADFPMSPSRNEFAVFPIRPEPVEKVSGIGMGADMGDGFNAAEHTSTALVWQLVSAPSRSDVEMPIPQAEGADVVVPALMHPIGNLNLRRISQRFGENPADYERFGLAGHTGTDFAVPVGTLIHAVDAGVVMQSNRMEDFGEVIKVKHDWGESVYAHLAQRIAEEGQAVKMGDVIGLSGNTGNSTGPHLHFGMRVYPYRRGYPYDGYADPLPYLPAAGSQPDPVETVEPVKRKDFGDVPKVLRESAREFGVDENLLLSVAWAESSFNPEAESPAGARGLGQLMPNTWAEWSEKVGARDVYHLRDNARVTAAYLAWCQEQTWSVRSALWAYVWGVRRVLDLGKPGKPTQPPAEVIEYANKILHGRDLLDAVGV